MPPCRILTFDGGGIRGVVTTVLIQRLTAEIPGWLASTNLFAGTSTGGLIALGLASGKNIGVIRDLYEDKGGKIFDDSWIDDVLDLGKTIGAEYDNTKLARELKKLFGDTTLGQLQAPVLIPSFDLDNEDANANERTSKPKLFHNLPIPDADGVERVRKVALYTTAAPTYFPSVDGYVDGGVFANNPAMCALAQSQDSRWNAHPALPDVVLLSLGTGVSLNYIAGRNLDWGYAQWAKPLISIMMDGVMGVADFQCKQLLGGRYERLAPVFPPGTSLPLDAVDRIDEMIRFAANVDLAKTVGFLRQHWV